jgi:hypothetical protein
VILAIEAGERSPWPALAGALARERAVAGALLQHERIEAEP